MSRKNHKRKKKSNKSYSTLTQHKQKGKKLIPPYFQIPKLNLTSWMNNRLPNMLWAILLISHLPRDIALSIFKKVAITIKEIPKNECSGDISMTGLAKYKPEYLKNILSVLTSEDPLKNILRPILLFNKVPAKAFWKEAINLPSDSEDWKFLMTAVASTLDHQSQESTDCRWLRIICMSFAGRLIFPEYYKEIVEEILHYPHKGDMKKVRPTIRAMEGSIMNIAGPEEEWSNAFWEQCMRDTPCFPLNTQIFDSVPKLATTSQHTNLVHEELVKHTHISRQTTDIDAKFDTIFGVGLFSLNILQELLRVGNCNSILGRLGLRTILELYISLKYLIDKNHDDLWKSFRVFGAGQAKLMFLKLYDVEDKPTYVNIDTLRQFANEDTWEEFLPINIGHWENSNLRKMSIDANVKEIYDSYYPWTSTFVHGHWGAIRDSSFEICGNPIHRMHRIPRNFIRLLPDVIPDVCRLIDKILEIISSQYPEFQYRVSVNEQI